GSQTLPSILVAALPWLYTATAESLDQIRMAHSIELREPFLDPEVIRVALATELRLNVRDGRDTFGKHVHRKAAQSLGIPKDIAYRVKEAAQHGSGMHDVIDAIAKRRGFDDSSVLASYLNALRLRERIGS